MIPICASDATGIPSSLAIQMLCETSLKCRYMKTIIFVFVLVIVAACLLVAECAHSNSKFDQVTTEFEQCGKPAPMDVYIVG